MKTKHLLALALLAIGGSNSWAIDKVTKKLTFTGEITSVDDLKNASSPFILVNSEAKVLYTPSGWDMKVTSVDAFNAAGDAVGGHYKLEVLDSHYLVPVYEGNGNRRPYWDGNQYMNAQPTGNVIFGLSGAAPKYGQDGQDLAVWDVTYTAGSGFAFHCVGRDIYLGSDATDARPSATVVYWKAAESVKYNYDADEVNSAYTEVAAANLAESYRTALNNAKSTYETTATDANLLAYGDAVNAAIDNSEKLAISVGDDVTKYIPNPDFTTNDVSGWNLNGKAAPVIDVTNHDCEFFEKDFNMSMTIPGMKKGTYEISFQAFQRPGKSDNDLATNFESGNWTSSATLYTTAEETPVKHICEEWQDERVYTTDSWQTDSEVTPNGGVKHYIPYSMPGGRAWFDANHYVTTAKAVVTEDGGSLTFGFRGTQPAGSWILFDNFKLTYYSESVLVDAAESEKVITKAEAYNGKMTASVKSALDAAINALKADKTNGGLYKAAQDACTDAEASIDAYAALKAAIDNTAFTDRSAAFPTATSNTFTYPSEAQTMWDAATATTDEVVAKANGMINAYRAYVRAIADQYTSVAGVKGVRNGWEDIPGAKNTKEYNNPANVDVAANTMYENYKGGGLAVGEIKTTVDNVPTGKYFLRMVSFTRNSINANDYIYIKSGENNTATALSLGNATTPNGFVNITDPIEVTNGQVEIGLHVGSGADWAAIGGVVLYKYCDGATMAVNAEAKYGTFCAPFAVTIPDGVTAYTVEGVDANDVLTMNEVGTTIPANTPVVLNAESGLDATTFYGEAVAGDPTSGLLTGVYKETIPTVGTYVLQNLNDNVAFYRVAEGKFPTIGANRCYLTVSTPAGANVRAFRLDNNANAIEAISAIANNAIEAIYNANGVKVNALQKGINVVKMQNGKTQKVLVK